MGYTMGYTVRPAKNCWRHPKSFFTGSYVQREKLKNLIGEFDIFISWFDWFVNTIVFFCI